LIPNFDSIALANAGRQWYLWRGDDRKIVVILTVLAQTLKLGLELNL
jgi:hypothetical protein